MFTYKITFHQTILFTRKLSLIIRSKDFRYIHRSEELRNLRGFPKSADACLLGRFRGRRFLADPNSSPSGKRADSDDSFPRKKFFRIG